MIESDLEDTHLCIKCSATIVGLEHYIQHRKNNCSGAVINTAGVAHKIASSRASSTSNSRTMVLTSSTRSSNLDHSYDAFSFPEAEPEPPSSYVSKPDEHGGKSGKTMTVDSYDLPYELGADVFFSSLQLQSVQAATPATGGKTSSHTHQTHVQRQKSLPAISQAEAAEHETEESAWIESGHAEVGGQHAHNSDTLMKAVSDIGDLKKPYEATFKAITFVQESPEATEDEDEEVDADIDDDDEEYDPIDAEHASGGKWKPRQSPPVVPVTHMGGKWKPEHRPHLRVAHTQLTRLSPNWDEQLDEAETVDVGVVVEEHPPAEHTKGKWIPGTKLQRLEYKEEIVELAKSNDQQYWCNICCRKLKSKSNYENHLKTTYHLKRAEPEQQLEKATLRQVAISENYTISYKEIKLEAESKATEENPEKKKKRLRRATFIKCELCKHVILRPLIGKHLISHYHYRRLQMHPGHSLNIILENIHAIVLQAPYQCRPCRFYSNTEDTFLQHWSSPAHLDSSEGPGKFWCSYCRFECEDNNQMRRHLLSADHKDVILAINRSVPICISKKLSIDCSKCHAAFRYNVELRQHMQRRHPSVEISGTASDAYQGRHKCKLCTESFHSQVALQRHGKHKHGVVQYFCSICNLEFNSASKARQHRKTQEHRKIAATTKRGGNPKKKRHRSQQRKSKTDVANACSKCSFIASTDVESVLHELTHGKSGFKPTPTPVPPKQKQKTHTTTTSKPHAPAAKEALPIECKDCAEVFQTLPELKAHRDCKHPLFSHVCMSCGESFARAQALGRHVRKCQPARGPDGDEAASASTATATAAEDIVAVGNEWPCQECNFRAAYKSELIYHRLHHSLGSLGKNQLIKCPICSKEFRKHSLRCHLRQHTGEKIFTCQFCNVKFSRRHNLKDHIAKLHLKKDPKAQQEQKKSTYQCDTCGKVFGTRSALKVHCFAHGAAKNNFQCTFEGCSYFGFSNAVLRIHLASHSQESFHCEQPGCSYVGKSLLHLRRHSQTHYLPSKLYSCDECDFKTRIKGHIRRHMSCHTGEKRHQCPHCKFRCSTLENLRKHVLKTNKHPGKFIYECKICKTVLESLTKPEESEVKIFKTNSYKEYQTHLTSLHNFNDKLL